MNIGKYTELYSEDLKLKNYAENTTLNYCNQDLCEKCSIDLIDLLEQKGYRINNTEWNDEPTEKEE